VLLKELLVGSYAWAYQRSPRWDAASTRRLLTLAVRRRQELGNRAGMVDSRPGNAPAVAAR